MASIALLILSLLFCLGAGQKTQLRVAFVYPQTTNDFGWTWRMNQGRIYMVGQLLSLYPGLLVQTYYQEEVPDSASPPDCPPIFYTWAQQKMDIIFGTSYGYQFCMSYLAAKFPDTLWFALTGDISLPLPNWGLGSAKIHHAMFLAGMVAGRETQTGKVGVCMPVRIPETYSHLAAFALGAAQANTSVKVITAWTDSWYAPERDVFMVQRFVAEGIDLIFHRCGSLEGVNVAAGLGVRSIGFNSEFKMLAGESLLLSPYFNWGVLFLQVARLVVDGSYAAALPVDLFPGLESNAVGLSDPSYLVHPSTMVQVAAVQAALHNQTMDTFCGPTLTNTGKVTGQAGRCLSLQDLRSFDWEPWNVVDRGHYALPREACIPGQQSQWDDTAGKYTCAVCAAGTYSRLIANLTSQAYVCQRCPADMYALPNSTGCSACPSGYSVKAQQDGCSPVPMSTAVLIGIIVGAAGGSVCLLVSAYGVWQAWKATADLRKLRKQFSNNNVAQECADAIACLNLESVAWLRTCKNPNKIQQSFLQILEMLTMVKPYIPDHVLALFTQRELLSPAGEPTKDADEAEDGGSVSENSTGLIRIQSAAAPTLRQLKSAGGPAGPPQVIQVGGRRSTDSGGTGGHPRSRGKARHGSEARVLPSAGEWLSRRCVYMVVGVGLSAPTGMEEEIAQHVGLALGEVVAIAKSFSATIDHVAYDRVALHWGLVSSVTEGSLKATHAALEMSKVRGRLPVAWRPLLRLSVSVVQGVCNVASISAAGHCFFVVGGLLLQQIADLTARGPAARCQCEVLVSSNVQQQVQYAMECMPRCFVGNVLFWQPLRQRAVVGAPEDEWMYELRHMEVERADKWCSQTLYSVFHGAAHGTEGAKLRVQVARLREQFKAHMTLQDEACLELLLAEGGPRL
eukprot:EG_transcript_2295